MLMRGMPEMTPIAVDDGLQRQQSVNIQLQATTSISQAVQMSPANIMQTRFQMTNHPSTQ